MLYRFLLLAASIGFLSGLSPVNMAPSHDFYPHFFKELRDLVCHVYKGIILHKDTIVFEDRRKVFAQDLKVYFSCDALSFCILVLLYYHQITPNSNAERCLKHLCFTFWWLS